jgi:cytochrome P450
LDQARCLVHNPSVMSVVTAPPPRGPKGHFLLGSGPELSRDQLGFYAACFRDYGDVVPVRLGPRRALLIYHPDAIEEVLVTRNRDFIKSPGVRILARLLGNGLFLAQGDTWLRQRRLVQPAFHRQRVAAYGEVMTAFAVRHLADWRDGEVRDIHAEMMGLTQAIVAKTLFDADVSDESYEIARAPNVLMEYFGVRLASLMALLPYWLPTLGNLKTRWAVRRLDETVYGMIDRRRRSDEDRGDLLSILLRAQDADDGSRMTNRQVRDEVMTLFLAGHETTAVALSWAWYLLAQHPEVEGRLAEELDRLVGDDAPTVADLPKLSYTDMVVNETMRLYPPAYAIGREAAKPTEVAGQSLARGDIVIMPAWVTHRDSRWFEEPEVFRPERWGDGLARELPRFAYFPFGGGPRLCIGNSFAQMEAVLLLATIARRFRLTLEPGQRITPRPYVTLRPEPGLRMRLTRR